MENDTEYNSLREEILSLQNREIAIAAFVLTAAAAIVGYGFTDDAPDIFSAALIPIWFGLMQFNIALYSKATIATYIRCIIEPGRTDLHWERLIHQLRKTLNNTRTPNPIKSFSATSYVRFMINMGWLCIIFTAIHPLIRNSSGHPVYLIPLASLALGSIWLYLTRRIHKQIEFVESGRYENEIANTLSILIKKNGGESTHS